MHLLPMYCAVEVQIVSLRFLKEALPQFEKGLDLFVENRSINDSQPRSASGGDSFFVILVEQGGVLPLPLTFSLKSARLMEAAGDRMLNYLQFHKQS